MTSFLESPPPLVVPPVAHHWTGPVMVFGGGVCIGFAPIGLRLGLDDLGPQAIAFWRYLFAAPVLLALVFLIERRAPRLPNRFVVMAGTFFALDMALWHWGLTLTTVSNATFIVNLGNVSVGFMAWLFLKERPTNAWFAAILLAVAGAAALSLGGEVGGKRLSRIGLRFRFTRDADHNPSRPRVCVWGLGFRVWGLGFRV